jgi:ATP-dependent Clp protease ATP-binding subunit ClpA
VAPSSSEGEGEGSLFAACRAEAEKYFGLDLLAQLDDVVVFRRLEPEHLARVLECHFERMSRWLAQRGIQCTLEPSAREFLLHSSSSRPWRGARDLVLAHRQEVEFPLADLLLSRMLVPGRAVGIRHCTGDRHLHFEVEDGPEPARGHARAGEALEIPIG